MDPACALPRPSVRSFVRRQGRFTAAQRRAFAELWSGRGLELGPEPLDLRAQFPGCESFVVEIGFGMGHALVELAERSPGTGFVGIEVHRPGVGKLLAMAQERQLQNLRVYCDDAVEVLNRGFADASLDTVLLLFPDPWHKVRHHKRRLVQPLFVELVRRKLRSGGTLHLATDWEDYARQMLEVMSAAPGWRNRAGEGSFAQRPASRPITRFERRGLRLGHGVWDLLFEKIANSRVAIGPGPAAF
ncbi:MAG: tRNA (guanosine(46)-N7)-methyltransferase TrmB [Gammaproteobacteria bacterium]|nr:tRNA (guanosine(46)-N7)-methyltransferase TrmB [Gammaproteobacteria bacterium]MBK6582826.1 tRNA (guanosine(46)-N7)-methyltransferase TrmB [Gammaproteobacteria bacterium]MBK7171318.1 tRNA (guanosine(46)-N7)-methyltransferase TrmB [Gammaproteobacteria bacterium]MBK7518955.1 tRNA (guanosine(46)-N7)-methyltransferase TrmB [Gammaproteobacteria bacterium]MBK7730302.1 tRNA (guanosine(46)-N7)-methyltransferase TrmB [Gammaproteobacteria bacterium]